MHALKQVANTPNATRKEVQSGLYSHNLKPNELSQKTWGKRSDNWEDITNEIAGFADSEWAECDIKNVHLRIAV